MANGSLANNQIMNLILTITKSPEGVSLDQTERVFGEEGGAIGRAERNAWALKDPERFISSHHCSIEFDSGVYYLADYSTNGTYVNHSEQPIGNGERVPLDAGMSITVGDYEFAVTMGEAASSPPPQSAGNAPIPGVSGPFAKDQQDMPPMSNIPADEDNGAFAQDFPLPTHSELHEPVKITPHSEPVIPGQENILDPLQAFDQLNRRNNPGLPINDGASFATNQGDHAPLAEQAFTPPKSFTPSKTSGMDMIPEDWDRTEYGFQQKSPDRELAIDGFGGGDAAALVARKAPPKNNKPVVNKSAINKHQQRPAKDHARPATPPVKQSVKQQAPAAKPRVNVDIAAQAVDNDLIAAMGLDKSSFSPEQLAQLNHVVGHFVRHTVEGLLKVLRARSTIKNELRLGVTTVQPRDNNPMKFSVNVDDALEHLFVRQSKGYLPPIASVNESFETILDHQVAVLAGMRAAFKSLLHKFDPVELTRRFDAKSGNGIFSGGKKLRYWEAYNEFFNEQVQDLDSAFQHLFGEEFVKAYESQLMELSIARKQGEQEEPES